MTSLDFYSYLSMIFLSRHSFYQTDSVVTIQVPIKGLKKEQVQVQTTDTTVCRLIHQFDFYIDYFM
jgi:hypothetical protein